ncbi:hypothetical protein, partial [Enterobacter hormaechei]
YKTALQIGAVVAVAALAFAALHGLLHEVRWRDVRHAFRAISLWQVAGALALTIASYVMLTLYDVLALRIIGRPLPYRT